MRRAPARLVPDRLAARFALLFAGALFAANLIAMVVVSAAHERASREGREARATADVERTVALVEALETARPALRDAIARASATWTAPVRVIDEPTVRDALPDERSRSLAKRLSDALAPRTVRTATLAADTSRGRSGPSPDVHGGPDARGERASVSIGLIDDSAPGTADGNADASRAGALWLNTAVQTWNGDLHDNVQEEAFVLIFALSVIGVLGLGLLSVRRLTRPLAALADAARAAGDGDRSARVAAIGARELREVAVAFNAMQERIARFDAERARTVAAVGHDLRTPITSLRIRAEMLDDATREPMVRTLEQMAVMADGLISLSRGQDEGETAVEIPLAELLRRLGEERGASVAAADGAVVSGRPVALARAFGNLVDNAIRYGGRAHVELRRADGRASVTVDDAGPGIPEERLADVFEPFVRGEPSRGAETGGAGLGLSIARTIVRAHGGSIALVNRDGGGLRASVSLPLAAGRPLAAERPPVARRPLVPERAGSRQAPSASGPADASASA